jgi:hypothetical protein
VRHASAEDLVPIESLVSELRTLPGLVERTPGCFYRRSKGFLHFHDDPSGLYADVRLVPEQDFVRMRVQTRAEQQSLLRKVRRVVGGDASKGE